jgi:hypothetical protein
VDTAPFQLLTALKAGAAMVNITEKEYSTFLALIIVPLLTHPIMMIAVINKDPTFLQSTEVITELS